MMQAPDTYERSGQASYARLWSEIEPIGRDPDTGGYRRFVWNTADLEMREWFVGAARARGMEVVEDGNGNQFACWGDPAAGDVLLLGSHLDSVPDGGAYDGPLGVVSSFAALDALTSNGVTPARPVVVANFGDEEGARFGIACAGSRLLTGSLAPDAALALTDADGRSLADVLRSQGRDPGAVGAYPDLLDNVATFVELHVEQGRALVDTGHPVGLASAIWPHGRYRFEFRGSANHAATTRMDERHDPMLTYAMTALAANKQARLTGARATFGRVQVEPNATNAVPSVVRGWMDARAENESALSEILGRVESQAADRAARDGTTMVMTSESHSMAVEFDAGLRDDLAHRLGDAPVIPTGAGHDAGVLANHGVPTAMLFVRNPTGVSHAPEEFAETDDCLAGVGALARVIEHLASAPAGTGQR